MLHKCFISFKTQDISYKEYIHDRLDISMIDKSLHVPINSFDDDYIMRKIREDYLSDSTVTIFLIGEHCAENAQPWENQSFIKRELQASLYDGKGNTKNGILGVVLPSMYYRIYDGGGSCDMCGGWHQHVRINNDTVVSEFSYNYYIPNDKCAWTESERYCVLTKWDDFCRTPNIYIDHAFNKRDAPISSRTKVRP